MEVNRRQFFKLSAAQIGTASLVGMGFSPSQALAEVRQYKLMGARETRNTCTYCSVGCGVILYSLGDGARVVPQDRGIQHPVVRPQQYGAVHLPRQADTGHPHKRRMATQLRQRLQAEVSKPQRERLLQR